MLRQSPAVKEKKEEIEVQSQPVPGHIQSLIEILEQCKLNSENENDINAIEAINSILANNPSVFSKEDVEDAINNIFIDLSKAVSELKLSLEITTEPELWALQKSMAFSELELNFFNPYSLEQLVKIHGLATDMLDNKEMADSDMYKKIQSNTKICEMALKNKFNELLKSVFAEGDENYKRIVNSDRYKNLTVKELDEKIPPLVENLYWVREPQDKSTFYNTLKFFMKELNLKLIENENSVEQVKLTVGLQMTRKEEVEDKENEENDDEELRAAVALSLQSAGEETSIEEPQQTSESPVVFRVTDGPSLFSGSGSPKNTQQPVATVQNTQHPGSLSPRST